MLREALKYLSLGWSVIPLRPRGKEPLIKWEEYQSHRPTEVVATDWFTTHTTANVGIVTGKISGLAVIDLDGPEGVASGEALRLSSPVTSITGKGKQLLYKWTEGISNSVRKYPGLDVRGEGGYIVASPSIHPNGRRYMWMNSAMLGKELPLFPKELFTPSTSTTPITAKPENWIADALENMTYGNIDNTLFQVCSRLRRDGYSETDAFILLKPHAERAGATSDHLPAKIRNVWTRYDVNVGQIPHPASSKLVIHSPVSSRAEYEARKEAQGTKAEFNTGYPTLDRFCQGLRRSELLTVAARTGVGKTNLLIGISKRLCEEGRKILFFSTEMSFDTIWDRYCAALDDRKSFERHKFFVCDEFTPSLERIEAALNETLPDVFIFDHINQLGDENKVLSEFMHGLKMLARKFNIPGIISAQLNRSADWVDPKTGDRIAPRLSHIKGSGSIEEVSAQVLLLSELRIGPDQNDIEGHLEKNRYGEKGIINFALKKNPYQMVEII